MPYEKIWPSKRRVTPLVSLVQIASLATFRADTGILVKEPIEGQDPIILQILFDCCIKKNRNPILRHEHAGKLFS
jgi:hypothetical protein